MKTLLLAIIIGLLSIKGYCQSNTFQQYQDSLKLIFESHPDMATRVKAGNEHAGRYLYSYPDSAIFYARKTIDLATSNKDLGWQVGMAILGEAYMNKANLPKTLELSLEVLELTKGMKDEDVHLGPTFYNLSDLYFQIGDFEKARIYAQAAIDDITKVKDELNKAYGYFLMSQVYEKLNKADSAMLLLNRSIHHFNRSKDSFFAIVYGGTVWPGVYNLRAKINLQLNKPEEALQDLNKILTITRFSDEAFHITNAYNDMALFYQKYNQHDSSIHFARKALEESSKISYDRGKVVSLDILSKEYESKDPAKALAYFKQANESRNSLYGSGNMQVLREMVANQEKRMEELELAKKESKNNLRQYLLLFGLISLLIIAFILYRNNKAKIRANEVLQNQKAEIENTLAQLKSTQSQLIQSEKMASLGELTAGIAHEIQNPLNFVNNFSEVSNELIKEIQDIRHKTQDQRAKSEEDEILNDIAQNLEKIGHHGKRAADIVKGMLQHSRTSSGQKELTDINALCDEYLRLSYHGLRAKDKSFNARFETDFDSSLPKLNVVPQDIGRVVLNLINNAFYAVNEKAKLQPQTSSFQPLVSISTKNLQNKVEITVSDNGNGIPENIKEKIFQPFFTTKPTGQGTGLGLSLSYDIVKSHGGELSVKTKEGEGSEFIIQVHTV